MATIKEYGSLDCQNATKPDNPVRPQHPSQETMPVICSACGEGQRLQSQAASRSLPASVSFTGIVSSTPKTSSTTTSHLSIAPVNATYQPESHQQNTYDPAISPQRQLTSSESLLLTLIHTVLPIATKDDLSFSPKLTSAAGYRWVCRDGYRPPTAWDRKGKKAYKRIKQLSEEEEAELEFAFEMGRLRAVSIGEPAGRKSLGGEVEKEGLGDYGKENDIAEITRSRQKRGINGGRSSFEEPGKKRRRMEVDSQNSDDSEDDEERVVKDVGDNQDSNGMDPTLRVTSVDHRPSTTKRPRPKDRNTLFEASESLLLEQIQTINPGLSPANLTLSLSAAARYGYYWVCTDGYEFPQAKGRRLNKAFAKFSLAECEALCSALENGNLRAEPVADGLEDYRQQSKTVTDREIRLKPCTALLLQEIQTVNPDFTFTDLTLSNHIAAGIGYQWVCKNGYELPLRRNAEYGEAPKKNLLSFTENECKELVTALKQGDFRAKPANDEGRWGRRSRKETEKRRTDNRRSYTEHKTPRALASKELLLEHLKSILPTRLLTLEDVQLRPQGPSTKYRWVFSESYPDFPLLDMAYKQRKVLANFSKGEHAMLKEAIDSGWLRAEAID
ncbi:hypothetical protein BJ508DRAFT_336075 [Ascobolus immersus RN42]|uniref:Uncharacterized protein n=1 Tax=Ascobolus immersus RN42 TaxID=1160509 RepID=A0A3N4HCF0_ASCIM|nr:hypothetical protein BJ508DRAFT_336075 [Ascobolus immersus RN42]